MKNTESVKNTGEGNALRVTDKEVKLLKEIRDSEYQDGNQQPVGNAIWLDYVCNSKSKGGVLTSLQNKGLITLNIIPKRESSNRANGISDSTVALTQAGFDATLADPLTAHLDRSAATHEPYVRCDCPLCTALSRFSPRYINIAAVTADGRTVSTQCWVEDPQGVEHAEKVLRGWTSKDAESWHGKIIFAVMHDNQTKVTRRFTRIMDLPEAQQYLMEVRDHE